MPLLRLRALARTLGRNRRYLLWRIGHPRNPFSDYYLRVVCRQLDAGRPHRTLGRSWKSPELAAEKARRELDFLRRQGLEPSHTVIDYGCGSLRLGRQLIELLEPGKYCGADITDRFWEEGLATIDAGLVAAKKPVFHVLSADGRETLRRLGANTIVSTDVLMHVPPGERRDFLGGVIGLMKEDARAFVSFRHSDETVRLARATWGHPGSTLRDEVRRLGAAGEILSDPAVAALPGESAHRVLCIARTG